MFFFCRNTTKLPLDRSVVTAACLTALFLSLECFNLQPPLYHLVFCGIAIAALHCLCRLVFQAADTRVKIHCIHEIHKLIIEIHVEI